MPITRAMGVRVEDYGGRRLVLSAPLEANFNHLGTAFGGSLNALWSGRLKRLPLPSRSASRQPRDPPFLVVAVDEGAPCMALC